MTADSSKLRLTRVPRQKLTETVANELLEAIRSQLPGARVPSERELTQTLGVGRSTVREALNGLALLGVVEIRHGQGVFVTGATPREPEPDTLKHALERAVTQEFIEARLVVEVEVARLAAQRRTEDDLRRLAEALDEQQQQLRGDVSKLLAIAANFNLLLAEAAHNEVLVAIIEQFLNLMVERAPKVYSLDGFREWDVAEHRALFEAVEAQNAELSAGLMRAHILQLADRYRRAGVG